MALVSAFSPDVLRARVRRLREKAAQHKAEVRRQRQALQITMAELARAEQECERLGVAVPSSTELHGEEARTLHGHQSRTDP